MQPRNLSECPVQNICQLNTAEAPACGSDPAQVWPVLAAEQVCVNALTGYWNKRVERPLRPGNPTAEATWKYNAASRDIELALSPDVSSRGSDGLFDFVESVLRSADDIPGRTLDSKLRIRTALVYLPAFKARRSGTELPRPAMATLGSEVASLQTMAQSAPLHKISSSDACTAEHAPCVSSETARTKYQQSLAIQLLCLRRGEIAYPALPREADHIKGSQVYEHDLYTLADIDKVPIHLVSAGAETSHIPADILAIDYAAIADGAADLMTRRRKPAPSKATTRHFDWLVAEAEGESIEISQARYLNTLSNLLLGRIEHYANGFEDED